MTLHVREFKDALHQLLGLYEAAGAKAPVEDLKRLLSLVDGNPEQSFDDFLQELERTLERATFKKADRQVNAETVKRHTEALKAAGTDPGAFEHAISALQDDKSASKEDVDAIAHEYTSGRLHWKTRKDGLDAIRTRFKERGYQSSKMKLLEKFTPW